MSHQLLGELTIYGLELQDVYLLVAILVTKVCDAIPNGQRVILLIYNIVAALIVDLAFKDCRDREATDDIVYSDVPIFVG